MEREQTKLIIGGIMAIYPNFQSQDLGKTVDGWTAMLKNYSYEEVSMALQSYITTDTKGFPPVIGQLIEKIRLNRKAPTELSEGQAWNKTYKAICNSNYNASEEFEMLPEDIKKAVGSPQQLREWAQMNLDDLEKVGKSHFLRSYRAIKEKQEYLETIPAEVRTIIESKISENLGIEDKENG